MLTKQALCTYLPILYSRNDQPYIAYIKFHILLNSPVGALIGPLYQYGGSNSCKSLSPATRNLYTWGRDEMAR